MTAPTFTANAGRFLQNGRVAISPLEAPEKFAEYHNLTVVTHTYNGERVFAEFADIRNQRLIIAGTLTDTHDDSDAIMMDDLELVEPHSLQRTAMIEAASDWMFENGLEDF